MKEKCCLLILNYNDSRTTLKLVDSVKNYQEIDKILIVDNCSTDDSYQKFENFECEKVITIKTRNNGGYGAGNNFGIKYAKYKLGCQYVIVSNPDVMFSNELIVSFKNIMRKDKNVAAVSAIQLDINGKVIEKLAWDVPSIAEYVFFGTRIGERISKRHSVGKREINNQEMKVDCVQGAFLMYDVEKFLSVGGYDENIFLYCEESTIGFKLKKAKFSTILVTNKTYKHEHSISINKSIPSIIRQREILNKSIIYFMKNYLKASPVLIRLTYYIQKHVIRKMKFKSNVL